MVSDKFSFELVFLTSCFSDDWVDEVGTNWEPGQKGSELYFKSELREYTCDRLASQHTIQGE